MIPEDRRDGPGGDEESTQLQAAGSVRKVGAPAGPGLPEPAGTGLRIQRCFSRPNVIPDSRGSPLTPRRFQEATGRTTGETEARWRARARFACVR